MGNGGITFAIRPAGREDGERIQSLVRGLSPRSRYLRFLSQIHELAPYWLERFTRYIPGHDATLLLFARSGDSEVPIGMAQYAVHGRRGECEFAVLVSDEWQGKGLGRRLVSRIIQIARAAGIKRIEGYVLAENAIMLRLARRMGFRMQRDPDDALGVRASLTLSGNQPNFHQTRAANTAGPANIPAKIGSSSLHE